MNRPEYLSAVPLVSPAAGSVPDFSENFRRIYAGALADNRAIGAGQGIYTVRVVPPLEVTDDGIAINFYDPSWQGRVLGGMTPIDVDPGVGASAGGVGVAAHADHRHWHGLPTGGTAKAPNWTAGDLESGSTAGVVYAVITAASAAGTDLTLTRKSVRTDYAGHHYSVTGMSSTTITMPEGPQGPQGPTGAAGTTGSTGEAGLDGVAYDTVELQIHYKGTNDLGPTAVAGAGLGADDWRIKYGLIWGRTAPTLAIFGDLTDATCETHEGQFPLIAPWPWNYFAARAFPANAGGATINFALYADDADTGKLKYEIWHDEGPPAVLAEAFIHIVLEIHGVEVTSFAAGTQVGNGH